MVEIAASENIKTVMIQYRSPPEAMRYVLYTLHFTRPLARTSSSTNFFGFAFGFLRMISATSGSGGGSGSTSGAGDSIRVFFPFQMVQEG